MDVRRSERQGQAQAGFPRCCSSLSRLEGSRALRAGSLVGGSRSGTSGAKRARLADGRLQVRRRAAGPALRHPERSRQPVSAGHACRRSFRRGFRARAAPSTRHRWCRPRPDQQPLSGCVGRDVLAGACVPNPGSAGAVPVRVRSRSSAGLRWTRGGLWHPRRQHRPLRTGLGSGDRCKGRRFAARRMYVPGILSGNGKQKRDFCGHAKRDPR